MRITCAYCGVEIKTGCSCPNGCHDNRVHINDLICPFTWKGVLFTIVLGVLYGALFFG
jgi:hypothetical protein